MSRTRKRGKNTPSITRGGVPSGHAPRPSVDRVGDRNGLRRVDPWSCYPWPLRFSSRSEGFRRSGGLPPLTPSRLWTIPSPPTSTVLSKVRRSSSVRPFLSGLVYVSSTQTWYRWTCAVSDDRGTEAVVGVPVGRSPSPQCVISDKRPGIDTVTRLHDGPT